MAANVKFLGHTVARQVSDSSQACQVSTNLSLTSTTPFVRRVRRRIDIGVALLECAISIKGYLQLGRLEVGHQRGKTGKTSFRRENRLDGQIE